MATSDELIAQLVDRGLPGGVVEELVRGIAGRWLFDEPVEVLADDLAFCIPRPGVGEVRVRIRPLGSPDRQRLTVVGTDQPGLLAATAGVLAVLGLSVRQTVVTTWPDSRMAFQALTVEDPEFRAADHQQWDRVGDHVREVISGVPPPSVPWKPKGPVQVRAERMNLEHTLLTVEARNRVGLLWAIASHLCDTGLNIVAAAVADCSGHANARFLADGYRDPDELARFLTHRAGAADDGRRWGWPSSKGHGSSWVARNERDKVKR